MSAESNINFKPWVGDNYKTQGFKGKRILVLGESHYCRDDLAEGGRCFPVCKVENMNEGCFSQTVNILDDYVNGWQKNRTYVCFERAIFGKELSQEEKRELWQGIVFYNYLQFSVGGKARISPQNELWKKSEVAFKEILEEYMPDYIIVWGVELFNKLPGWDGEGSEISISENDKTDVWTYTIKGKKIPALKVCHPSTGSGNCWTYWHQFYVKFLGL